RLRQGSYPGGHCHCRGVHDHQLHRQHHQAAPRCAVSGTRLAGLRYPTAMEHLLQLVVVSFAALATGGLVVNWIGLGRAMSQQSASAYVEFHQATNRTFDPYMPIVVVGALLGGIVLVIGSPGIQSPSGELATVGCICYVGVLAIAVSTNVRIK